MTFSSLHDTFSPSSHFHLTQRGFPQTVAVVSMTHRMESPQPAAVVASRLHSFPSTDLFASPLCSLAAAG